MSFPIRSADVANRSTLGEVFRIHAPEATAVPSEETLIQVLEDCRDTWPKIELDDLRFVQALAERLSAGDAEPALEKVHAADLYLAFACADGQAEALAAFDRQFLAGTSAVIAGVNPSPGFIQDVQQQLREKLFLSRDGQRPKIHGYSGQGSLKQWLRSAALRTALNMREVTGRHVTYEGQLDPLVVPSDPELDLMKNRYREDFKIALQAAFAGLSSRDRTVLRLHWVDGLNIDKIGVVYQVHRSTVARWISQTRQQLLEDAKRALKTRLGVSQSEVRSLVGMLRSQLHLSVSRVLKKEY